MAEQSAEPVRGEIIGLDFEADDIGTIVLVRVPFGTRLGHWWVSLAPVEPDRSEQA
jgi:hypothetical protein